jgi:hypothetical protein
MDKDTRVQVIGPSGIRVFFIWVGGILTIIVLGTVGYALYLVHAYIQYVGYVWLASLAIAPTLCIVAGITWLIKYILQADIVEIGPSGQLIRWLNRVTEYHPLGIKEHRVRAISEKVKVEIPSLVSVLKEGLLGNGDLLLGYHKEGDSRWGTWDDLRSFVVAGKSRSGKTVTMVFYILQALLGGAKVYVCDPHYNKPTGLLKILEPLWPYLVVARTEEEIVSATCDFRTEMLARKAGKACDVPMVIVYDEWSELLRELADDQVELVVKSVLNCNEAYAGFNGFAMVGGHEWTAKESGGKKGTAVRRGFHAIVCHRLDDEYAKFLLKNNAGKKAAMKAPSLPKGQAFFQDSEGEIDYILIPYYGDKKEAVYQVSEMMQQIEGPVSQERLTQGDYGQGYLPPMPLTLSPGTVKLPENELDLTGNQQFIVNKLHTVGETFTGVTNIEGTSFTPSVNDDSYESEDGMHTPEKETRILLAAFKVSQNGTPVTRTAIMNNLGWNKKQWPIIKAVCDKHQIAM